MTIINTNIFIKNSSDHFPFEPTRVEISENYAGHHFFEIFVELSQNENFSQVDLEKITGECLEIQFENESGRHLFLGFVDSCRPKIVRGIKMLTITGFSPTILMDSAALFRTFSEKNVADIVRKIGKSYQNTALPIIKNEAEGKAFFSIQTGSDYQYLCKLADEFQVNFYYDGTALHFKKFGKDSGESIQFEAEELLTLEANVNLCPLNFELNGYDYEKNEILPEQQKTTNSSSIGLAKLAVKKSGAYPTMPLSVPTLAHKEQLPAIRSQIITQQTNDLLTVSGSSTQPSLKVGASVTFGETGATLPGINENDRFLITKVQHFISEDNSYHNQFSAIPADHPFPVNMPNVQQKRLGPLVAEIVENADDAGFGRVKVKFLMDLEKSVSCWIRYATPFTSNDGFYFLPEKGEKVMVFFENGLSDGCPIAMGGFYQKDAKASRWSDQNNRKKGIATEKITFQFDDNSGELFIKAEAIILEASQKIELSGGQSIKQTAQRIDLN